MMNISSPRRYLRNIPALSVRVFFTPMEKNNKTLFVHMHWSNPFSLTVKKFVPIDGLTYKGHQCGIFQKKSVFELIAQISLLFILVVVGCGVLYWHKSRFNGQKATQILSIAMVVASIGITMMVKRAKPPAIRYVTESPEILQAMEQIEAGVSITDKMIEDIKKVHQGTIQHNEINGPGFTLDAYPGVVFKESLGVSLDRAACTHRDERFFNMVVAKALVLQRNWTHLIIPSAKQVTVDDKLYIVEKRLDIIVDDER